MEKSELNREYYRRNTPYPVRLGGLKARLQQEAMETGSTIHQRIVEIIDDYYNKREIKIDVATQKLLEMAHKKKVVKKEHKYWWPNLFNFK